jgi:hypothetical protein
LASLVEDNLVLFYCEELHLKSGLIRGVGFGGSGLIYNEFAMKK